MKIKKLLATSAGASLLLTAACADNSDESTNSSNTAGSSSNSENSDVTAPAVDLATRQAQGELKEHGGARRIEGDQKQYLADAIANSKAKNVILLIGDGMGDSEITAARNVAEGAGGTFKGLDALPVTGQYTHYSLDKDTGKPDYVTDSAASGSAWATGTKTYDGAISVNIDGKPQASLLEIAKAHGLATGDVSTAELQDATPAVQVAHVGHRKCYGPEDAETCGDDLLEKGGRGSIAEQLLNTRADVTLGGGKESFEQTAKAGDWEGKTLLEQAKERGYQVVEDADSLQAVDKANQDQPVLGLFADGNMPVRWEGKKAEKQGYLKEAQKCQENPERTASTPKLADMTSKAIDLLKGNDKGFFLQVEGASIDKQDHNANPCGQIGETADLDEAVQKALEFAKEDGETLVVVTADHAHTSQIIDGVSEEDIQKLAEENNISVEEARETIYPGLSSRLETADGGVMTVGYATSENTDVEAQGHTGTQLRIAAYGPHSANVAGLTDQTDLFFTIVDALGMDDSKNTMDEKPTK